MLEELEGLHGMAEEEEQRNFVCLLIQTTLQIHGQLLPLIILLFMEQSIKLSMDPITTYLIIMSPVLSAMLPPELQ